MSTKKKLVYVELPALKGRIKEMKSSYRILADKVNCSTNTLYLALNGYGVLGADDIELIAEELEIQPSEITRYFFPRMLRNAI
jgi:hypothetical protein